MTSALGALRTLAGPCLVTGLLLGPLGGLLEAQQVWYVDDDAVLANGDGSSWVQAFAHPDDAFAAAQAGDEIRIAQGHYVRSTAMTTPAGLVIRGGYGGVSVPWPDLRAPYGQPTILDGDVNGDDTPDGDNRVDNITRVLELGQDTVLDGLVVRGGREEGVSVVTGVELVDCVLTDNGYLLDGVGEDAGLVVFLGTITLRDCQFVGNWGNGAAVSGERVTAVDCRFEDNEGSGAWLFADEIDVLRSTFARNLGGGARLDGSPFSGFQALVIRVTECAFEDNRSSESFFFGGGGGAWIRSDRVELWRSRFRRNTVTSSTTAMGGGALVLSDEVSIRDCEFADNVAGPSATGDACGGGLALGIGAEVDVELRNCTLVGNHAFNEAGGLFVVGDWNSPFRWVEPRNSIFWDNTAGSALTAQFSTDGTVYLEPEYSCIQDYVPNWGGLGTNTTDEPLLAAPEGPDGVFGTPDDGLRLTAGSPCIDAGNSFGIGVVAKDLALRARRVDDPDTPDTGESIGNSPVIDMGAYEFGAPLVVGQWFDRGAALAGSLGEPRLEGAGTLLPGTFYRIEASAVPPQAPAFLVLGFDELSAPFKGGTMVPSVDFWISMPVSPSGDFEVSAPWPAFPVSDQTFWWQLWILDPAGPFGFSASNGLTCTAP